MTRFTTLTRNTSLRVAGAVAALAVTAPFTAPVSAGGKELAIQPLPCKPKKVTSTTLAWERVPKPVFEPGLDVADVGQDIVSFAVSPSDTRKVAVTNGNSVYVSHNGGCSWDMAVRLDRVPTDPARIPLSGLVTTIRQLYIAPGSNTFFALAEELETGATVGRPHVLRSDSGQPNTWAVADDGLPPLGKPLLVRGHRTNRNVLYLSFSGAREESTCPPQPLPCDGSQQGQRLGLLYASTDGGRTWASRTDPGDLNSAAAIKYFSVEDNDGSGNTVWVVANGLLRKSTNGGRTYEVPDGLNQEKFGFTAVESLANTAKSDGLELVAFGADRGMIRLHRGKWTTSTVPFYASVESVAQRPEGDIAVATAPASGQGPTLWRIYPRDFVDFDYDNGLAGGVLHVTYGWEGITPPVGGAGTAQPATLQAGPAGSGGGTYYTRDSGRLYRFLESKIRIPDSDPRPIDLDPLAPPRGHLTPAVLDIDLPVGKERKVDYVLTLPPAPTPLDVYLLVDNSGSMLSFITDLKYNLRDVALALHRSGVDVHMGVGQINVQPDKFMLPIDNPNTKEVDESKPRPIYQALRKIGPINGDLFRQLDKLDGASGGGDEPQLEALWQSVTGRGLSFGNLGYLVGYQINPEQDAGFRDALDPIKVIVHATDEKFSTNIEGPAHNDKASVIRELKNAGVKQIGLSQDQEDAAKDLRDIARGTGAIAPPGGTDCDGDGHIGPDDVPAGRPLVCGESDGLDRTLLNLLNSLSDRQPLKLNRSSSPTLASMSRSEFVIDAKRATRLKFSVRYSCKGIEPGSYANEITASLRDYAVAKAVATINCGGLRTPAKPPAVFLNEPGNPPPPPQPQPVVPAPVPVNPVPQPQTQVQVQSQVNPQGGMADQEEEQFQLAAAENDAKREDDQLAMSGLSYGDAAAGAVVALGMTMAGACAGVALRRRSRTAAAKVTVRH